MTPSQRIVLNTAATYTRSVLNVALALFSSRWVLNALGQTDFGLYSVVGSLIVFITFLNNVMSGSVGRHYAFAIGQENSVEVNRWFNAALCTHLLLAIVLVLAGWILGEFVIAQSLNIPAERIATCIMVFRISLVAAFVNMISVPFVAMFIAKQHITEISVWSMLQSVLVFTLAFILTSVSIDRLLFYALGMAAILVFIQCAQIVRAVAVFVECGVNFKRWFDKIRFLKIFSFASWSLFGGLGATLRDQGSVLLLNLYFGPQINAAFGIATQVSAQTNQLATAMLGAFAPEITTSEGRGDRTRMLSLALRSCKFGTIMVMLFAIPLMLEMEYVLELWLGESPPYTALFCRLILCAFLIDRLTSGYMLAVNAYGKIAGYQASLGAVLLLTLPLAWLFLELGFPPTSVGVAFILTMMICSLGRIYWARRLFNILADQWLTTVALPCSMVAFSAVFLALVPLYYFPPGGFRFVLTTGGSASAAFLATWFIALQPDERQFFKKMSRHLLAKCGGVLNTAKISTTRCKSNEEKP